jgi:hypothetical protein
MGKLSDLLHQAASLPGLSAELMEGEAGWEIKFSNDRRQQIDMEEKGDRYRFSSCVLGSVRAKGQGHADLLRKLWLRNDEIDVVAFTLDRHKRLVGEIELLGSHLDAQELAFYLICLAEECDRLEFTLLGRDLH